jgi:hypothetical protein
LGGECDRLLREKFYQWGVIRVATGVEECGEGAADAEALLEVGFHTYDASEVFVDGL